MAEHLPSEQKVLGLIPRPQNPPQGFGDHFELPGEILSQTNNSLRHIIVKSGNDPTPQRKAGGLNGWASFTQSYTVGKMKAAT